MLQNTTPIILLVVPLYLGCPKVLFLVALCYKYRIFSPHHTLFVCFILSVCKSRMCDRLPLLYCLIEIPE